MHGPLTIPKNRPRQALLHVERRLLLLAVLIACAPPRAAAPIRSAAPVAPFLARSPNDSATPPRNRCWMNGRFDGVGILHERQLQLVVARGGIAGALENDKTSGGLPHLVQV